MVGGGGSGVSVGSTGTGVLDGSIGTEVSVGLGGSVGGSLGFAVGMNGVEDFVGVRVGRYVSLAVGVTVAGSVKSCGVAVGDGVLVTWGKGVGVIVTDAT